MRLSPIFFIVLFFSLPVVAGSKPILIGLDADMSSGSAQSGKAIQRGTQLAIDEINDEGGVLGRKLKLVVKDHRGNPTRGIDNITDFSNMEGVVAVMGGLHTPVAMQELKTVHQNNMIFLIPWAAGTPVIENGYNPNYAFRVSARDQYVGGFLVKQATKQGYKRIGLLLERTGWGRSNQKSMTSALNKINSAPVKVEWFHWGDKDFSKPLTNLRNAGAEVVLLVANAPEGKDVIKSMANITSNKRMPIVSHWGITGGDFFKSVGHLLGQVDLQFLQTYSFAQPDNKKISDKLVSNYCKNYGCSKTDIPHQSITSPVGTAHAYDLVHLLAKAIKKANTTDRASVRNALETLPEHRGLVKHYQPPFTVKQHDALNQEDFRLTRYSKNGVIVPVIK